MKAALKIKGQGLLVAGCLAVLATLAGALAVEAGPAGQSKAGAQQTSTQGDPSMQPLVPVGSGFTYSGRLKNGGSPANGAHDFTFKLYDALTGGSQVGTTISVTTVLTDGLFTVVLDFGSSAFQGQARWVEGAVRPTGAGAYTTLSPRQALSATPYASGLVPGAAITGSLSIPLLSVSNSYSHGYGVYGEADNGYLASGVYGNSIYGRGVYGHSSSGFGVHGTSTSSSGVYGTSSSGNGVYGGGSTGVYGRSTATGGNGVYGFADTGTGASGVYGLSPTGRGVYGSSTANNGEGVYGVANTGTFASGVYGNSPSGYGVFGYGPTAVYGMARYGGDYAGYFNGNVEVTGTCCAPGRATSKIDHPVDPENKYLHQALVESPDMMNIYNGNVTTDARGEVVVQLPAYVEALNKDFRYQLTVMGQFADAIVLSEVKDNRFTIKTDKPNVKVSWQVTGIRKDPYARAHPLVVEQEKKAEEKGKYRHPREWGQPESKGVDYEENKAAEERAGTAKEGGKP